MIFMFETLGVLWNPQPISFLIGWTRSRGDKMKRMKMEKRSRKKKLLLVVGSGCG